MFDPKSHLIQLPRRTKDRTTGQYVTTYDDYLEVKWRVVMFREKYPHGSIITEEICVDLDKGYARYKAHVGDGEGGIATGYGTETVKDFADFAERAETRAIGRALALLGFGTQFVGTDLTEGDHVADAPVAPPQIPTMDTSIVPSTNGHLPPPATTTNPPRSSAAAENSRPSEPVTPHPLQEGEGTPSPVDQHPTVDEITRLVQCALAANHSMEAFGQDMRRLMHLPEGQKITKKFLRERMTMAQYEQARAHYGQTLAEILNQDVPDYDGPAQVASQHIIIGDVTGQHAEVTTGKVESRPADDPADKDRAIVRALAIGWGLPPNEVEYVLTHHRDPEKARNILWKARQQRQHKPELQPSLTEAAD
jgi:hypothetical protein